MDGSIQVTSSPGFGSSFRLEIPYIASNTPMNQTTPAAADSITQPERPLLVLIAEDNLMNRRTIELILQKIGHRFTSVTNGREAVERWQQGGIDLILMDIQMPEMDGPEAAAHIRRMECLEGSNRIPIIALTADALKGTREELQQSGFDGYLTKPVRVPVLAAELARFQGDAVLTTPEV